MSGTLRFAMNVLFARNEASAFYLSDDRIFFFYLRTGRGRREPFYLIARGRRIEVYGLYDNADGADWELEDSYTRRGFVRWIVAMTGVK